MTALASAQAARDQLHQSTYWPAAQRQKGTNHLWLTDVHLAATIALLTGPPLKVSVTGAAAKGSKLAAAIG